MKTMSKQLISFVLAFILCLSLLPVPAVATDTLTDEALQTDTENPVVESTPAPEPTPAPDSKDTEETPVESESPDAQDEPQETPSPIEQEEELPVSPGLDIQPVLTAVVDEPLVKVVYQYGSGLQAATPSNLTVSSSHAYYALGMVSGDSMEITANHFPGAVPVSTENLSVLLNGTMDVTMDAEYDPATGKLFLPARYMGHRVTATWTLDETSITDVTISALVNVYEGGMFSEQAHTLTLPSDASEIAIPLPEGENVVASQNGIDLPGSAHYVEDGVLHVAASPLGGDITVTAYVEAPEMLPYSLRSSRPTQVAHTRSADQIWYGYYTSYYTANGNTAFCLDPTVSGLDAGTYSIDYWLTDTSDLLVKCCYYLFGGPGYSYTRHIFTEPDELWAYGMCHAVASYAYMGSMDAFKGLDDEVSDTLVRVAEYVERLPDAPDGFACFVYNSGSSTNQPLIGWLYEEPDESTGRLEIRKVSADPGMTDGNACYSLAGAVFDVYDSTGYRGGVITTDEDGYGELTDIPEGTGYYIVERTPPKGYAATGQRYTFAIVAGETTTVTISNVPQNDPSTILLQKLDADGGGSNADGPSLAGAQFTVKYYKGHYSSAAALNGVSPARTWVVETDSDGFAMLHEDYLVSGDPLYYNSAGNIPTLPLGTVSIQETLAPEGYLINDELFIRQITASGSMESVETYNAPIVEETRIGGGGVVIEKWDAELNQSGAAQGDASLAGAVFEIINRNAGDVVVDGQTYAPGEAVYTLTTDAYGRASTPDDLLPYGKYEIIEKTPPTGYTSAGVTSRSFEIGSSGEVVSLTTSDTAVKNNVIRGGVEIEKWDAELNQSGAAQGDASLIGAVFEIVNRSVGNVIVDGKTYAPGEVVWIMTTDKTGTASTPDGLLPYGSYDITEKTPPAGYTSAGVTSRSFEIRTNGQMVSLTTGDTAVKNNVIRGGVEIEKWDAERNAALAQGDASIAGAVFEIVNRSAGSVIVGGKTYAPGAVVTTLTTDDDGRAATASNLLPYGKYEIVEKTPPTGYTSTGESRRSFEIKTNGQMVSLTTSDTAVKNSVIRGGVEIEKWDAEHNAALAQGDAFLAGAVFEIVNRSAGSVIVGGKEFVPGAIVATLTTDDDGRAATASNLLPYGKYEVVEKTPPTGYTSTGESRRSFEIKANGQMVSLTTSDTAVKNSVIRGGVEIEKWDAERNAALAQGDASIAGAVFEVVNRSAGSVIVGGKEYAPGQVVHTLTTDEDGAASTANDLLPYGTYEIVEKTAPTGYFNTGAVRRTFTIRENGKMVEMTTSDTTIKNDVIRGGVSVEKWDVELDRNDPQGDATLSGAVFEIYNRSQNSVVVSGMEYASGQVVHTLTTDEDGSASTENDLLPYGTYEIVEKTAPTGYFNTGAVRRTFTIREDGKVVEMTASDTAIKNDVIRGGVEIEKWDIERNEAALKQGDATLAGAVLDIYNTSKYLVLVDGVEYEPGEIVLTLATDENGYASTAADALPYGSYEIVERTAPTGYLNSGVIRQGFRIREDGAIVSLTTENAVIKNDVIRGNVLVEKWDNEIGEHRAQGGGTLEGATFEIVNRSADSVLVENVLYAPGEVVYTMITDETGTATTPEHLLPYGKYEVREITPPLEGYLATGVLSRFIEIREHGQTVELNTAESAIRNDPLRGDLKGIKIADGTAERLAGVPFKITSKTTGESHVIVTDVNGEFSTAGEWNPHSQNTNRGETDRDGIWFGELDTLDDSKGALLYDDYIIEELPCEANEGFKLLSFEISVYRHNTVIDLGTLTDDFIPQPEIFTTAAEKESMGNTAYAAEKVTIVDTVYYSGLKAGIEYTLKGVLMDKATGEPLMVGESHVIAEKTFRAAGESGSVTMEFTFDASALKGKAVVVFERLYFEDKEIAVHADIEDADQTISFLNPEIGTTATGPNGEKVLDATAETVIVDTVAYTGLLPGQQYTLKGQLMDKATGEPVQVDGQPVTAETSFTTESADGTVQVIFTLNAIALKGKSVVVFESLLHNGREIASHADIGDEGQTVSFNEPKIGTMATGPNGEKELSLSATATIVDTVKYENLAVGQEYTLKGTLMDKATGKPVLVDDKEVAAQTTFTPEQASGTVTVTFTFDASALAGKQVVVFERLYLGDAEIAAHADIEDKDQTVAFTEPKIGTTASGKDGEKQLAISKTATIIDKVKYEGLTVGEKYVLKGTLMDKSTGKALLVGDKEITAETSFTPEKADGSVEVTFTFDASSLKGKEVVVFERLYIGENEIAAHADIEDKNQTVSFTAYAMKLTKIDRATDKPLDGAEFTLYGEDGKEIKLSKDKDGAYIPDEKGSAIISTVDGVAIVKDLTDQKYTLREVTVPKGYVGYTEPIPFEMEARDTEDDPFPVTVYNSPEGHKEGSGAKTGRDGLPMWMLYAGVGLLATAMAAAYVWHKKKNVK